MDERATTRDLVVRTAAGLVRGVRDRGLVAWRGIPYAAAPVGPLRFRAPQRPLHWDGVRDATAFGPVPSQPRSSRTAGAGRRTPMSEDSLTISVVRRASDAAPRPVLVFAYGGAYGIGAEDAGGYRGDRLAARGDVVFVSFNYRLGALGWLDLRHLATPDAPIDANCGLRDHLAALEWVRDNIAAFGGDPDDVTLFGESAGGTSVLTLLAVPAARGLFARAIAESAAPGIVVDAAPAQGWADRVADRVGGPGAIRTATPEAWIDAVAHVDEQLSDEAPGARLLAPVVDGDLLPAAPLDAAAAGATLPVPLVIGTNADEGTLFQRLVKRMSATPTRVDTLFAAADPGIRSGALAAYPRYPRSSSMSDLVRDVFFWQPSVAFATGHAAHAPTWMYRFDHVPRVLGVLGLGATHAAELPFVFGRDDGLLWTLDGLLGGTRDSRAVMRQVQRRWLAFARTGEPGGDWPRYDAERRATLLIAPSERVELDPAAAVRRALEPFRPYARAA